MMSPRAEIAVQSCIPEPVTAGQSEWVERCRASILERDPLLATEDIFDLATTLWDRPSCRMVLPELAAGLLFAGRLSHSN